MSSRSVCVVDDDDLYRELLEMMVKLHCGVGEVRCFASGEDALEAFANSRFKRVPDLMLLDFHMGGMDAPAVIRSLKSQGIDLPVAVVSGATRDGEREACLAAGAVDFLPKTARFEELLAGIQTLTDSFLP